MKSILFAAALAVSMPALAQDMSAGQPTPPPADAGGPASDATTTPPSPTDTTTAAPDATMPATQPDTSMTTQTDAGATADPAGTAPAPAPAMAAAPDASSAAMANAPAAGDPSTYPTCSKTVQDRCVNRSAGRAKRKG